MGRTALIVVDVQYDFLPPDGALAVPEGREIIPLIKDLLDQDKWDWECVIASQDYHPPGHISFASSHPPNKPFSDLKVTDFHGREYIQTLWPDHCVQGSEGVEIEDGLKTALERWGEKYKLLRKGTHPQIEAYSAFDGYIVQANEASEPTTKKGDVSLPAESELSKYLRSRNVDKVLIVGVATDFCVGQTAISSLSASFDTLLVGPAIRAISSEGEQKAFEKIEALSGKILGRHGEDWQEELRIFLQG